MPQMSQVLRERAIGMLTAGMSTRAVALELNVHFSTISRLQRCFREFGSTSNRLHNRRPRVTTPAQDLHIQHLHLQDRLRPATRTAAATIGLHNQRISAQTVRNRLREAHLHARRPHWGLDLTAVCRRNRLEWANAHIRWRLALWRGVLLTDESRFSLYRADGRQRVWHRVGERFADVKVVDRVAHGGGGVMVWAGVCYGHEHRCILLMAFWMHRDTVTRSWGPLLCHPATSHSHWRGVDQHSTGHNQQPDQLYAKEMCCTAWGKWWSHQILTGFRTPTPPPSWSEYFRNCWSTGIFMHNQEVREEWPDWFELIKKAMVTQITACYNRGMHKSISEHTTQPTLKQMSYSSRRPHRYHSC